MIDFSTLSNVSLIEKRKLPNYGGIYFAYKDNEVFYIGKTKALRSRWVNHQKFEILDLLENIRLAWIRIDCPEDREKIERRMINMFFPKYNKQSFKDKDLIEERILNKKVIKVNTKPLDISLGFEKEAASLGVSEIEFILMSGSCG